MQVPQVSLTVADYERLVDVIEDLKLQDIDLHIQVPQIVVLGDRSSGKSSVLEALTGVAFPIKGNLCTRYPIELVLTRKTQIKIDVRIIRKGSGSEDDLEPGDISKSEPKNAPIRPFEPAAFAFRNLAPLIQSVDQALGLKNNGKSIKSHTLRIAVSGPKLPTLTLVDLPGFYEAPECPMHPPGITDTAKSYVDCPDSIILAEVSSKIDYKQQGLRKYLSYNENVRSRTIGIITKTDKLQPGSEREHAVMELAVGRADHLGYGWHILKNRDYRQRVASTAERDDFETEFLRQGAWAMLPADQVGVGSLRARLAQIVKDRTSIRIPKLIARIEATIGSNEDQLHKLGDPRSTRLEQQLYLCRVGQQFSSLIKSAANGVYDDRTFFGDPMSTKGYERRLGACIQSSLTLLGEELRLRGHAEEIVDELPSFAGYRLPRQVLRVNALTNIHALMQRSRGASLPGTVSSQVVGDLVSRQAAPWKSILETHTQNMLHDVNAAVSAVIHHVADEKTADDLLEQVIYPGMESLKDDLLVKLNANLEHHKSGYLTSYHKQFADEMKIARQESRKLVLSEKLHAYFRVPQGSDEASNHIRRKVSVTGLLEELSAGNDHEVIDAACLDTLNCMQAYYKACTR